MAPHPYSQSHSAWGQVSLGQAREPGWCPQGLAQTGLVLELLSAFPFNEFRLPSVFLGLVQRSILVSLSPSSVSLFLRDGVQGLSEVPPNGLAVVL